MTKTYDCLAPYSPQRCAAGRYKSIVRRRAQQKHCPPQGATKALCAAGRYKIIVRRRALQKQTPQGFLGFPGESLKEFPGIG